MEQLVGTVNRRSNNYGKDSIEVDGVWFSNKFKPYPDGVIEGATVRVEFKPSTYKSKFWDKIEVVGASTGPAVVAGSPTPKATAMKPEIFPVPYNSTSSSIVRQNALTNAVKFVSLSDGEHTVEEVLDVAVQFEAYTSGKIDKELMAGMTDDMSVA